MLASLNSSPQVRGAQAELQWRAARELWHRGVIDWKLFPEQALIEKKFREVQKKGGKLLFVNCSRRLGKTIWAAEKSLDTAFFCKNPKPRIRYGSAYYDDLEEFTIPAHELILEDCPSQLAPLWVPSLKKYKNFKSEAEIKLVGLDLKPHGMRGNYADLIIIEEGQVVRRLKKLYSTVLSPMTMYRPGAMVVIIGTAADTPDHDYWALADKAINEDAYIELTIEDNTRLTEEEKQEYLAECLTESDRQREYYCKRVIDESMAIIPEWDEKFVHEVERDQFFPFLHKYDAMDIGIRDQTVVLFGYYDFPKARLIIEDEVMMHGPDMTTDKLADAIRAKEKELWEDMKVFRRVSDNDNLLLLQDLASKHSLPFMETTKSSLESMVNNVRIWVRNGRIIVSPKCKMLTGCLRSAIWNKRRSEFDRSNVFGHYDALAALVYFIRNIAVSSNPIPPMYRISEATHFVPPDLGEQKTAHEFKKMFQGKHRRKRR